MTVTSPWPSEPAAGQNSRQPSIETAVLGIAPGESLDTLRDKLRAALGGDEKPLVVHWLGHHSRDDAWTPTLQGVDVLPIIGSRDAPKWLSVVDACGGNGLRVVPASAAVRAVRRATTMEEFGAALTQLRAEAGLSLNNLAARFHDAGVPSLTKSTLSRSCNGITLFQTEEQVVAFVTECGETDATEWVAAWERARADRQAREHHPSSTEHTSAPSPAVPGLEPDCPDDEVLGEFHVRFTRRHLQTAIVLGAVAGLAATTATSPGVRNTGVVVLGLAAGLALLEQIRASTAPTSPSLPDAA